MRRDLVGRPRMDWLVTQAEWPSARRATTLFAKPRP